MAESTRELRGLRLTGAVATTEVRFGTLLGVEHVIAPIVMLVGDSIIFPINAEHPEFVPADVLGVAPAGWNGRPLMSGDHPSDGVTMLSANIPVVLEGQQFGSLFNARFENNRLQGEVWIDPARAAVVPDGLEILQRIKDGKPVEISVGAFVVIERTAGQHNGQDYGSIWREVVPDHIALLREGLIGACSIEMGCGTPRALQHHVVEAAGMRVMTAAETTALALQAKPEIGTRVELLVAHDGHDKGAAGVVRELESGTSGVGIEFDAKPGEVHHWCTPDMLRVSQRAAAQPAATEDAPAASEDAVDPKVQAKLLQHFGSEEAMLAVAQGVTDTELRELLMEALKRIEPQACYIQAVSPDDKTVVYLVDPDPGGPMPLKPYMRSYSQGEGGAITFAEERVPVRRREEWVPVQGYRGAEADAPAAPRGACSCGGHQSAPGAGGRTMKVAAERITALIENPRSPFAEADRAYLETLSEERIADAETKAKEPAAAPAQEPAPGTVQVSEEELTSLRTMAAERQRTRDAQKKVLVGKLKTAQTTYTEQRLNAMELEQLREIAALVNIDAPQDVEFVSAAAEVPQTQEAVEPPKPWSLALAKRNGQ